MQPEQKRLFIKFLIQYITKAEIARILHISNDMVYKYENYVPRVNYKKINRMMKILLLFRESRNTYGASRIKLVLCNEGDNVSIKTVSDYMKELNLIPKSHKERIINRRKMKVSYDGMENKIRYIIPSHINQIWTGDITEIKTDEGKCYLSTIMDRYSRKIISYEISDKMDSNLVTNVLKKALDKRKPKQGILIHTDKGSQYRSKQYIDCVKSAGAFISYTRLDYNCADNAIQESFHASLKKEELYTKSIKNIQEARERVNDYINNFYNPIRYHSVLKTSPNNFEHNIPPNDTTTNDINFCYINRIDLCEGVSEKEKDRMYKNLIEMGYEHNAMYLDLNERIKIYKQKYDL